MFLESFLESCKDVLETSLESCKDVFGEFS